MRKLIACITIFLSAFLLAACGRTEVNESTQAESTSASETTSNFAEETETASVPTTESEPTTEAEEQCKMVENPVTHYFIKSGDSSTKEGVPRIIHSADEFEAYCEQEKEFASKKVFQVVAKRFDKTFWEKHDLLLLKWVEGNDGATTQDVMSIKRGDSSDTDWVVNMRQIPYKGVGNAVLTPWLLMIEISDSMLKDDDVIRINYVRNLRSLETESTYLHTDMWKPEDGDESEYLNETPVYFMDTKTELDAYCKRHPELGNGFLEACAEFNDEFWKKQDLLLVVLREESGTEHYGVYELFKNEVLDKDKWFVDLVKKIPLTQSEKDESIWHIFIRVESGKLKPEDEFGVYKRMRGMEE